MDFLKALFGDKALTFDELTTAIQTHNGNEANKDNQIKVGNLGGGEYVGKAKHDALQALLDGKEKELTAATTLIEDLKKSAKGDEALQGKITAHEATIAQLQEQLHQTQIDSGLQIALLEAGAIDVDYLIYKAKKNNGDKPFELGEDGKVKGVDDLVSGLKTQNPEQFKKAGGIKVEANPLPNGEPRTGNGEPQTLADALRMQYENK